MTDEDDITTFWPNWLAVDTPGIGLWTLGYAASGSKWREESMPLADRGNQVLDLLSNEGSAIGRLASSRTVWAFFRFFLFEEVESQRLDRA